MESDGGADVFKQLRLSGEPLIVEKRSDRHKDGPIPPIPLLEYQDLALDRIAYCESYAEYWESTEAVTGTGRPSNPSTFEWPIPGP